MRYTPVSEKYRGINSDGILCRRLVKYRGIYRLAALTIGTLFV